MPSPEVDLSDRRLLIVDDSAFMRQILRNLLQGLGVRMIAEADSGAAALELLGSFGADVVLLDLQMPVLGGLDVLRMVRRPDHPAAFTPIIVVSAYCEKFRVIEARNAGAHGFLRKPISAAMLRRHLVDVVVNPRPYVRTKSYFGPIGRFTGAVPGEAAPREERSAPLVDVVEI